MPKRKVDIAAFAENYVKDKLRPHAKILELAESDRFAKHKYSILRENYQGRPINFIRDVLGIDLWAKQMEIVMDLENLRGDNPSQKVSAVSSHNTGKSFVGAAFLLYKLYCYDQSLCLVTAPTHRQVSAVLFSTLREISPFPADFVGSTATEIRIGDKWKALGFTASSPDAMAGLHPSPNSEGGFILVDEASGISSEIFESLDGIYSDNFSYLLLGNPLRTNCEWYRRNATPEFKTLHISALDHPNILREQMGKPPLFPNAIRLNTVRDLITRWCKPFDVTREGSSTLVSNRYMFEFPFGSGKFWNPNNLFLTRFLGEWPREGEDSLFDPAGCDEMYNIKYTEDTDVFVIGVDVARYGDDFSAIIVRHGDTVVAHDRRNGFGTVELAGLVLNYCMKIESTFEIDKFEIPIMVDDTGIGGAVTDYLIDNGYNAIGINFAQKAVNPDKFFNARTEMFFRLSELINDGKVGTSEINTLSHKMLSGQLVGLQFSYDDRGRYKLERKADYKKRTKVSPDDIDALALAFYYEVFQDDVDIFDDELSNFLSNTLDSYNNNRSFYAI